MMTIKTVKVEVVGAAGRGWGTFVMNFQAIYKLKLK